MRSVKGLFVALCLCVGVSSGIAHGDTDDTDTVARGADVYAMCIGCHSFEVNRTGPMHCHLLGRKAGTVEGFDYSDAMRESDIVWTRDALDRFLEDPLGMVKGTTMMFAGVKNAQDRHDLVAFLAQRSSKGDGCVQP